MTSDEMIAGAPIFQPGTFEVIAHAQTHKLTINFWYKLNGHKYFITHTGITPYIYWNMDMSTIWTDHEAPKKSLTDAIKKCLSVLGFCADVYQQTIYDDPVSNEQTAPTRVPPQQSAANDEEALEKKRITQELTSHIKHEMKAVNRSKGNVRQGYLSSLISTVEQRCHKAHLPTEEFLQLIEQEAA